MKKFITNLLLSSFLLISVLTSCNKSDARPTVLAALPADSSITDAARHHNNCCCCPSAVAIATGISYSLNFVSDPNNIGISANISYTNAGPQGTFRITLITANGNVDSVAVVPANHTNAGEVGAVNLQYWVPYAGFPCTLQVNGRPANLRCDMRTKETFTIENNVSRSH